MHRSQVRWIALLALCLLFIPPIPEAMAIPIDESAPEATGSKAMVVWNTFLGGAEPSRYTRVVTDDGGNSYVAGESESAWGEPIRPFTGAQDVFVAKLDALGDLIWLTFLGGDESSSYKPNLALDEDGFIYVAGQSWGAWSCLDAPCTVRPYSDSDHTFAAKLAPDGTLLWNTFLGGDEPKRENLFVSITVARKDAVYVTGWSRHTWGSPVRAYTGIEDAYVARLDAEGNLVWNTFLGSNDFENGNDIDSDSLGNVYVIGTSNRGWSCDPFPPSCLVRPYTEDDVFVAKLGPNGSLLWNTFLGGLGIDTGNGIVVDEADRVFVTGTSMASWGAPVRDYTDTGWTDQQGDAFVARLDTSGNLLWNTFLGGDYTDAGYAIDADDTGNVYVAGKLGPQWSDTDIWRTNSAFASGLDTNGMILWMAPFGSYGDDVAHDISARAGHRVVISGESCDAWGSPIRPPFPDQISSFVAQLTPNYSNTWMPFVRNR